VPATTCARGPFVWTAIGVLDTVIVWPGATVESPTTKLPPEGAGLTTIGDPPTVTVAAGGL
jgi:hypothetical protein